MDLESFEGNLTRRQSLDSELNQTVSISSSRKTSSDEEGEGFLNKRELKSLSKLSKKSQDLSPDMSMIFTPLVKVPTTTTATTTSTKSSTSSVHDEPQNLPKSKPQASVFLLAKNLASKYNGECLSTNYSICKGKNALKFHCVNTHTFFIPVEDIVASSNDESSNCSWCYRCEKFFEQC